MGLKSGGGKYAQLTVGLHVAFQGKAPCLAVSQESKVKRMLKESGFIHVYPKAQYNSCAQVCMRSLKDHGKIVKSLRQIVLALQMNMKLLYVKVLLICLNRRAAQIVRLNSHRQYL